MVHATFFTYYSLIAVAVMIVFMIPVVISFLSTHGLRKGFFMVAILSLFAWGFESLSIYFGFPYGLFTYGSVLGDKLLGLAPFTTPFGWLPLFLGAIWLAGRYSKKYGALFFLLFLVAADIVLDPGAVSLGFWSWASGGTYYGVPMINFFGWLVSGVLGYGLYTLFRPRQVFSSSAVLVYYTSIPLWTTVALWQELYLTVVFGIVLYFFIYFLVNGINRQATLE